MKFTKGQWYLDEGIFYQYQYQEEQTGLFRMRQAGQTELCHYNYIDGLQEVSLTPDFTNAKVGDECWHGVGGFMIINDIYDDGKAISIKYDNSPKAKLYRGDESDLGGITTIYTYRNGYMPFRHPELFNSFAQFQAYWAEEGLKLKGGKSD